MPCRQRLRINFWRLSWRRREAGFRRALPDCRGSCRAVSEGRQALAACDLGPRLREPLIIHQPFVIGIVDQLLQQCLPSAIATPSAESSMRVLPAPIRGRQIPPRRTCPRNPAYRIDKSSVVVRDAAPHAFTSRQSWLKQGPRRIRDVMPLMRFTPSRLPQSMRRVILTYLVTALSRAGQGYPPTSPTIALQAPVIRVRYGQKMSAP
jgi:hypothetical protein